MSTLTDTVEPKIAEPALKRWARYGNSPYLLGERIAAGGMGTVHLGLKRGALGFRRLLAIKRLHGHLAQEADFVARFKDEIRLVSRLNHPNIVQTLDVLEEAGELALVMEFVEGLTLNTLLSDARIAGIGVPTAVAVGIVGQALHGLHSAHELVGDCGNPLHLVHRDVSPQNIIIAKDGLVKVLDFGVAKASIELHVTRTGQISGKASYMSPEQIVGACVDRRTDIFAAGVVLWETLTGQRLFRPPGTAESAALRNVLDMRVTPPSELCHDVSPALERVVLRALDRDPKRRFGSARDFALALEDAVPEASASAVADGVAQISGPRLARVANVSAALRDAAIDQAPNEQVAHASPSAITRSSATAAVSLIPVLSDASTQTLRAKPAEPELLTSDVPGVPMGEPSRRLSPWISVAAPSVVIAMVSLLAWQGQRLWGDEVAGAQVEQQQENGAEQASRSPTARRAPAATERRPTLELVNVDQAIQPSADAPLRLATELRSASKTARPGDGSTTEDSTARERSTTVASAPQPRHVLREPPKQKGAGSIKRQKPEDPAPKCSPPTYTDAEGIRHFKPECL